MPFKNLIENSKHGKRVRSNRFVEFEIPLTMIISLFPIIISAREKWLFSIRQAVAQSEKPFRVGFFLKKIFQPLGPYHKKNPLMRKLFSCIRLLPSFNFDLFGGGRCSSIPPGYAYAWSVPQYNFKIQFKFNLYRLNQFKPYCYAKGMQMSPQINFEYDSIFIGSSCHQLPFLLTVEHIWATNPKSPQNQWNSGRPIS